MSTERKKEIKAGIVMIAIAVGIIATLWFISVLISKGSANISNKGITWNVDFIDEDGKYKIDIYGNDVNKNYYVSIYDDKNQLLLSTYGYSISTEHNCFYLEKDKNYTIKTNSDEIYQMTIYNIDNKVDTLHIWTPDKTYSKDNIESKSFENWVKNITDRATKDIGNNAKDVLG